MDLWCLINMYVILKYHVWKQHCCDERAVSSLHPECVEVRERVVKISWNIKHGSLIYCEGMETVFGAEDKVLLCHALSL